MLSRGLNLVKPPYVKPTYVKTRYLSSRVDDFIMELDKKCGDDYQKCLEQRKQVFLEGNYGFRENTRHIRDGDWKVYQNSKDEKLKTRHVEITGPGNDKKMIINALNSGADGYMVDLEDSMTPTPYNISAAHQNIYHAVRGDLIYDERDLKGEIIKTYDINREHQPNFFVRPRGLHLTEQSLPKDVSASIFDIGTHLYNNGEYLYENNRGPYLYIPKLESYEDAKFINKVIAESQDILGLPQGTVKTTVLLETFPAIFQTHEIIYALREHIAALNCGRWDYLFSMIKCLGNEKILPNRDSLNLKNPFLEAYVYQVVSTCHQRGIHAMGGMSNYIPNPDPIENDRILNIVKNDKLLEIKRGCDGAWVAHPGLVECVKQIFKERIGETNQINKIPEIDYTFKDFTNLGKTVNNYNYESLQQNINISLQYISAWLSGNGAVVLNGLMEDLATAEISIHQIKQWYSTGLFNLNKNVLNEIIEEEYQKILNHNEITYAIRHLDSSKQILKDYIYGDYHFLPQVAEKYLEHHDGFKGITFSNEVLHRLGGSKGYLDGVELTRHRGEFLNKYLYGENNKSYKFLGTSNGVSAVNVVAGGDGKVGPYAGGWQTNAMKNRLGMCLPDTLHVSPEEAANCAAEINHHLERADQVQHIQKLSNSNFQGNINYHDIALLADMEQGWNTPEKTRISVKKAIENGINVIHIEDQGEKKRCGHLGDKELNPYDEYALILRSANLAAQEILGSEQAEKQWVRFVARTDAYSAKRIVNSSHLYDKNHWEYKFIDWERDTSPDGKYLYLKQGVNPNTGRKWGLEISIERCARVVDEGLASHVWMETPDADLQVAHDFLEGVNKILIPKGKKAYGLYNHSPSFDWDVKFFKEAESLTQDIVHDIAFNIKNNKWNNDKFDLEKAKLDLSNIIKKHGSKIKGDHNFSDERLEKIIFNAIDYYKGLEMWNDHLEQMLNNNQQAISVCNYDIVEYVKKQKEKGFTPKENISEIIVEQRLCNFSDMLASFGFNMHLITLPEFHITAFNMHKLSRNFYQEGINAFVEHTQRPERILSEKDNTYTYYKHQTATGTGVEAAFSEAVGSSNVNILSDSTESDDLKLRE